MIDVYYYDNIIASFTLHLLCIGAIITVIKGK